MMFFLQNFIIHSLFTVALTLILTYFNVPVRVLEGLFTYIHPENVGNDKSAGNSRAVIKRPGSLDNEDFRRRNRSKEKFEFDESKGQIFRLRLVDEHLESRLYYPNYRSAFTFSSVAILNFLIHPFLPETHDSDTMTDGTIIAVIFSIFSICTLCSSLAKLSFERSATKRYEKELSILSGFIGFAASLVIIFEWFPSIFEFKFDFESRILKVLLAVSTGFLSGFLLVPCARSARSFWLGTDQLRWNLSVVSGGKFTRILLYVNYLIVIFSSILWINPISESFVNKNNFSGYNENSRIKAKLTGNIGLTVSTFTELRILCLFLSGISLLIVLRPNLQMYLNEAVLSWYQRLHASKVPNLDFSRAKIFLHNYYLCLVVLQFFVPAALVLNFLCLSQVRGNLFIGFPFLSSLEQFSPFIKEISLFCAWWVVFIWAIFTTLSLALYRYGVIYIS